jgi:glucose-6-phosphate dehydrogenase assembly protein OpcA
VTVTGRTGPEVTQPAPTEIASWSGRAVTTARVSDALDDLRHTAEHGATRTSVVNLVVAAADHQAAQRASSAMRRLGPHHPGRTIAIICDPHGPEVLDARAEIHGTQEGEEAHAAWWEEVHLELGGELCAHRDSVVNPLLLPQLPVAVWFPSALPTFGDPLLELADALLVDARWAIETGSGMPGLVELSRRHTLVDLSWKRLTPWRSLLAHLFDPEELRPYVRAVTSAEVSANAGPGRLLAGWLMDRLGLSTDRVSLQRAKHATMRITAAHAGSQGTFCVTRPSDEELVLASAEVDGTTAHAESRQLPAHGLTWSLADALSHLTPDHVYEHSIRSALAL